MKRFCIFLFITTFALLANNSFAQNTSFHIGGSFPIAEFGDDDEDDSDSGLAGTGFTAGFEVYYPLSDNGLSGFIRTDVSYNPLNKDFRDDVEDDAEADTDITFSKYISIPVSVGLQYTHSLQENLSIYGKGGGAMNFLKKTEMEMEIEGYDFESKESYEFSTSFGLLLGAGVVINDKTTIGLSYYSLGEHEIEGEWEENYGSDSTSGDFETEQKISFVTLTVGFRF